MTSLSFLQPRRPAKLATTVLATPDTLLHLHRQIELRTIFVRNLDKNLVSAASRICPSLPQHRSRLHSFALGTAISFEYVRCTSPPTRASRMPVHHRKSSTAQDCIVDPASGPCLHLAASTLLHRSADPPTRASRVCQ